MKENAIYYEDKWKEIMAKKVRRMEITIGVILTLLLSSIVHVIYSSVSLGKYQYDTSLTLREVEKSVSFLLNFQESVVQTLNSQSITILTTKTGEKFDTHSSSTYFPLNAHQFDYTSPKIHNREELKKRDVPEKEHDLDYVRSNPNLKRQDEAKVVGFQYLPSTNSQESGEKIYESKNNIESFSTRTAQARNKLQNVSKDRLSYNHKPASRKLEIQCNGTMFKLDIQLDSNPSKHSWTLTHGILNTTVTNTTYDDSENWKMQSFEKCLTPGPYKFTIQNSGDYNISLDSKLIIEESQFSKDNEHLFDSTSLCILDSLFPLKIQLDLDGVNTDINLFDIQSKTVFEIKPLSELEFTYFACLSSGLYDLTISEYTSYQIFLRDELIFEESLSIKEENIFSNESSTVNTTTTHEFILTSTGLTLKNPICHKKPMLAPYNFFSNFTYDERTASIVETIHGITSLVLLNDIESPQYKAACFMLYDDILKMEPNDPLFTERYAIATLLYATNHPVESILQMNTCEYYGLKCVITEMNFTIISEIDWSSLDLKGSLPFEISRLRSLEKLNLSGNNLQGIIPTALGLLINLHTLMLNSNQFTGEIPAELGNLSKLKELMLSGNPLHGPIPPEIGQCTQLERLGLYGNGLTGSIPSVIFECTQMTYMDLGVNKLNNTIPTNIGQLELLNDLLLDTNKLTGSIPSEIGKLTSLTRLWLNENKFSGLLPEEMEHLNLLEKLQLNDNLLFGRIPNIFQNFTNLTMLYLMNNDFSESIPDSIWSINSLQELLLHNTKLTGTMPREFCDPKIHDVIRLEDSQWFMQTPNVYNECAPNSTSDCHIFSAEENDKPRACPEANKKNIEFFLRYNVTDTITNTTVYEIVAWDNYVHEVCLSPTGCHQVDFFEDSAQRPDLYYYLNYNRSSKSLARTNEDTCDPVNVSGVFYDRWHHKRIALNHLTQMVIPEFQNFTDEQNSAKREALTWIMQKDNFFDQYKICDGTLLQRFVLAYFYISHESLDFDPDVYSSTPTCNWDHVTCNSYGIVTELTFAGKDLSGTLITEIGLLQGLRRFDVSNNAFTGSISSYISDGLTNLESFNISENSFEGTVPKSLYKQPTLKHLNIASNKIGGKLSADIEYSKLLEIFNVSNNMLGGTISSALLNCKNLQEIDLSRNSFTGDIPLTISNVKGVKIIDLSVNKLSGRIPAEIFELPQLAILLLGSNELTGNIPEKVGDATELSYIHFSHNTLKGTIPKTFENLSKLKELHLHDNFLYGDAPNLFHLKKKFDDDFDYITDCGNPHFLLEEEIKCDTCTLCCNSEETCQIQDTSTIRAIVGTLIGVILATYTCLYLDFIPSFNAFFERMIPVKRDVSNIYQADSIFSFVFACDTLSSILYILAIVIQMALFSIYIMASLISGDLSDWKYSYRCVSEGIGCMDVTDIDSFGWALMCLVIFVYVGTDMILAFIQIRMSIASKSWRLACGGIVQFVLAVMALITSVIYNNALAESNTDLITNAVILMFINDIDEKMLKMAEEIAPNWTRRKLSKVEDYLRHEINNALDERRPSAMMT